MCGLLLQPWYGCLSWVYTLQADTEESFGVCYSGRVLEVGVCGRQTAERTGGEKTVGSETICGMRDVEC